LYSKSKEKANFDESVSSEGTSSTKTKHKSISENEEAIDESPKKVKKQFFINFIIYKFSG